MAANTRFVQSVELLSLLAQTQGAMRTSTQLAEALKTHPVMLRRLARSLSTAGLVVARKGPSGGMGLAIPARDITLADIYLAVQQRSVFHFPQNVSPGLAKVNKQLEKNAYSALKAMLETLGETTLAQIVKRVRA